MVKLIYGVGLNDADYTVNPRLSGKRLACPLYRAWKGMLERSYCASYKGKHPTYVGVTVCEEWLTFSNFKAWSDDHDYQGKELDKDLLVNGNKVYSPETCAFIDKKTNTFITDGAASRGVWPIGVSFSNKRSRLQAHCRNPFTKKQEFLGYFDCPNEAHEAWKKRKHELALQLADIQVDKRVADSLRVMFA